MLDWGTYGAVGVREELADAGERTHGRIDIRVAGFVRAIFFVQLRRQQGHKRFQFARPREANQVSIVGNRGEAFSKLDVLRTTRNLSLRGMFVPPFVAVELSARAVKVRRVELRHARVVECGNPIVDGFGPVIFATEIAPRRNHRVVVVPTQVTEYEGHKKPTLLIVPPMPTQPRDADPLL